MEAKKIQNKSIELSLFVKSGILLLAGMFVGFIIHKVIGFGKWLSMEGYSFGYPIVIALSLLIALIFIAITYKHIKNLMTTYYFAVMNVFFLVITTMIGTFLPQWNTFNASVKEDIYYNNFSVSFFTFMGNSWYKFAIVFVILILVYLLVRIIFKFRYKRVFTYLILGFGLFLCLSVIFSLSSPSVSMFGALASKIIIYLGLHDFYHSGPYTVLYVFLLVSLIRIILTKPFNWRFTGFHLLHISLIIIVMGAWLDFLLGFKGVIHLELNKYSDRVELYKADFMGRKKKKLDFYLKLDKFETKKYDPDFHIYLAKVNQGHKEIEVETPSGKKAVKKRSKNEVLVAIPLGIGNSQKVYGEDISYKIVKYIPDFYINYINFPNRLSKHSFEKELLPRVKSDNDKNLLLSAYKRVNSGYILKKDIYKDELLSLDVAQILSSIPDDILSANIDVINPGLFASMSSGKVNNTILFRHNYNHKDPTNGTKINLIWSFSKKDANKLLYKVKRAKKQSKHYIKLVNGDKNTIKTFFKPGDVHKVDNSPYKIRLDKFYKHFYIKEKVIVNDLSNPINPVVELSLLGDKEDIKFMLFENYDFPLPDKLKKILPDLGFKYSYDSKQMNKVVIAGKDRKIYSILNKTLKVEDIEFNKPYIFGDSKASYTFIKMYNDIKQVYPFPANALPYQRNPLVLLEVKTGGLDKLVYLPNIRDNTGSYRYSLPNSDYILYLDSSKQSTTKYWQSTLSIFEDKKVNRASKTQVIRVNEYMKYNGYRFYQTNASEQNPYYSGIGITYEPGLYIVYFGFVVLLIGVFITLYIKPKNGLNSSN